MIVLACAGFWFFATMVAIVVLVLVGTACSLAIHEARAAQKRRDDYEAWRIANHEPPARPAERGRGPAPGDEWLPENLEDRDG